MTRRPASGEAMFRTADADRGRFGEVVGTWQFIGRPAELVRELRAAIRRGEAFARRLLPLLEKLHRAGVDTNRAVAESLNALGVATE